MFSSLRLRLAALICLAVCSVSMAADKPRVLILGDSISIGYTPYVQKMMEGEAIVKRPMRANGQRAENCSGTTYGVENVERWLKIDGGDWDVIHFNWGLHDMKREDPKTKKPSRNPDHPRQADVETYEKQLRAIVKKLQQSDAKLIFCTTTPVPTGVSPHRDTTDPAKYNTAALKIMKEHDIAVDDLYTFANSRLDDIQRPNNVHFTPDGSKTLAEEVVKSIREALEK
ncbi:SGNH/GDSL hydrolase family protein [Thalassoroseus pseudoceratinae]|uniref:SGNH/GDSL hydrolase family protein n=1 Tax=Thalassoroseus pseudoceratinae TaxID=2713176 RepID=UPI00141FC50E|nr:SGNH/GDSL hydrolase family protein [Thalassoroseus pseudoceratinae]